MVLIESLDSRRLFSAGTLQNAWTTIGNGPSHTNYVPGIAAGLSFNDAWTAPGSTDESVQPIAVGGGRVYISNRRYFGSEPQSVMALDPATGQVLWTHAFPPSFGLNPPTYADGRVYVQWGKANDERSVPQLYALDATTGRTLWSTPFNAQWEDYLSPAVDSTGIWVNGGTFGGFYGFAADGTQRTFVQLAQIDRWTPTLAGGYEYTFVGDTLDKYDQAGNRVWRYQIPHGTYFTYGGGNGNLTAVAGDTAYITAENGLRAIDLASGTLKWAATDVISYSTPAVANGVAYVGTVEGVRAYRATDGTYLRTYPVFRSPDNDTYTRSGTPIVTDDRVIFTGDSQTLVYALDGTLLQTMPLIGPLAIDHNSLYINATDGRLHAFALGDVIRGTVFNDVNRNGMQDGGEAGTLEAAAGVYLDLDDSGTLTSGDALASNADAGGRFQFAVSPGTYTVRLILPDGAVATTAKAVQVTVVAGVAAVVPSIGLYKAYSISGVAQRDYDADGVADHGVYANHTIYADLNFNDSADPGEPTTTTKADGRYTLDLPAGQYVLRERLPAGYVRTTAVGGPDQNFAKSGLVRVAAGLPTGSYDFLSRPETTLVVKVFEDKNADGVRDSINDPLSQAANVVYLDSNNNNAWDPGEPTDSTVNGTAAFAINAGSYVVRVNVVDPARIPVAVGTTVSVATGVVNTVNVGLKYAQVITAGVFEDANGNGVQEPGEPPFDSTGLQAYLDLNASGSYTSGEPSAAVTSDGTITFTNVAPGQYTLRLRSANSNFLYKQTAPVAGLSVTVAAGQAVSAGTFGVQRLYTVFVGAFNDADGNGVYAGADRFVAGRTVYADLNDNAILDPGEPSTMTATYFSSTTALVLPAGTYRLRQVLPVGYIESGRWTDSTVASNSFVADGRVRVPIDQPFISTGFALGSRLRPATVISVVVDDGTTQRSRVRSLSVLISGDITLAGISSGAFILTQTAGSPSGPYFAQVVAAVSQGSKQTLVTLAFSGAGMTNGSLGDGHYRLTIDGNKIKDVSGLTIDAAGTGVRGTSRSVDFARLASDFDGDGAVGFNDFLRLQNAFGTAAGEAAYQGGIDGNGDGRIDFNDFLRLQNDFGHTLPIFALASAADTSVATVPPSVVQGMASFRGTVFNDHNRNGKFDRGDGLARGVRVFIDADDDGVFDATETSVLTDRNGRFAFTGLAAGTYHARQVLSKKTTSFVPAVSITLTAKQAKTGILISSK